MLQCGRALDYYVARAGTAALCSGTATQGAALCCKMLRGTAGADRSGHGGCSAATRQHVGKSQSTLLSQPQGIDCVVDLLTWLSGWQQAAQQQAAAVLEAAHAARCLAAPSTPDASSAVAVSQSPVAPSSTRRPSSVNHTRHSPFQDCRRRPAAREMRSQPRRRSSAAGRGPRQAPAGKMWHQRGAGKGSTS